MVRFLLNKVIKTDKGRDLNTPVLIFLSYSYEGVRLRMSTGERIAPRDWNQKSCRPRSSAANCDTLTGYLDRMERLVKDVHLKLKSDMQVVTPAMIKEAVHKEVRNKAGRETLIQWIERYSELPQATDALKQNYHSILLILKQYPGAKDFPDITEAWFLKFQRWMEAYRDKQHPIGYKANYIHKAVRYIKEFCNQARRAGVTEKAGWVDMVYRAPQEEVQSIYLTLDELTTMHTKKLPAYLRHAADRFLIGAFTGLRFSDFSQVTPDAVRGGMIHNRNQKTGEVVVIPIHPVVSEIFERYGGKLPRPISNPKMNKYIKEVGRLCEINTPVEVVSTRGGKKVTDTIEKYKLITTHTARRSAATNMYIAGIQSISIMKITGHKTEKSFMKYIRISQEENARLIQNHAFFIKP